MKRPAKNLSFSLERRLSGYALAASAAGVGVLALAQAAEAKIVYTKAHRYVPFKSAIPLDLNRDGIVDFKVGRYFTYQATFAVAFRAGSHNAVAGLPSATTNYALLEAFALNAGSQVGYSLNFSGGWMALRRSSKSTCAGRWNNVKNRYLGLLFQIKGKYHFGWARFNESCDVHAPHGRGAKTLLTGYAYETIPGKSIIAGRTKGRDGITVQEGSLGHLARGASVK